MREEKKDRFPPRDELAISRVDDMYLLIAQVTQSLCEIFEVTVYPARHEIVDDERTALLQCPQGFQHKVLTVHPVDVVVDVIAGHEVKCFIGEAQMPGIALLKENVRGFFPKCVTLAKHLAERRIDFPPIINPDHSCVWIPFGAGDGQCATSTAYIQSNTSVRDMDVISDAVDDPSSYLHLPRIGKCSVEKKHPARKKEKENRYGEQNSGQYEPSRLYIESQSRQQEEHNDAPEHALKHPQWYPVFVIWFHIRSFF